MINIQQLSYTYHNTDKPAIDNISLEIPNSAFVLVCGDSGSGKSTLLRAINGLIPHFYGGIFSGEVHVNGINTLAASPRQLANIVGFVFQEPHSQFVLQTVEDEIAFGLENLGILPSEMPARIETALAAVDAKYLQKRSLQTLSGGEAQRVAIACALVMQPKILILDEPTSQLDANGVQSLAKTLKNLHQNLDITIILAEHRLQNFIPLATHCLVLKNNAEPLFDGINHLLPYLPYHQQTNVKPILPVNDNPILKIQALACGYENKPVIENFNLVLHQGECITLVGSNGSGKSTLLKTITGLLKSQAGSIYIQGKEITKLLAEKRVVDIAYVPQNSNSLLFADTLLDELLFTIKGLKLPTTQSPKDFLQHLYLGRLYQLLSARFIRR